MGGYEPVGNIIHDGIFCAMIYTVILVIYVLARRILRLKRKPDDSVRMYDRASSIAAYARALGLDTNTQNVLAHYETWDRWRRWGLTTEELMYITRVDFIYREDIM